MPLLCITLLALLLLPLCLSCDSARPHRDISNDYRLIVQTDLNNTRGSIATLLHNSSCPELKHKPHGCTTGNTVDVVRTLHILTCKTKHLRLSHTDQLLMSVLNSLRCPCLEKPTKEPHTRLKKRRTATRRETKKLCKARAILAILTECYEKLNFLLGT